MHLTKFDILNFHILRSAAKACKHPFTSFKACKTTFIVSLRLENFADHLVCNFFFKSISDTKGVVMQELDCLP